jgi:hypothetical protein
MAIRDDVYEPQKSLGSPPVPPHAVLLKGNRSPFQLLNPLLCLTCGPAIRLANISLLVPAVRHTDVKSY